MCIRDRYANEPPGSTRDDHMVDLDNVVAPKDLAGIEVYPGKEDMPEELLNEYEGCGMIVAWTKIRHP